jgi:hypothetical protein
MGKTRHLKKRHLWCLTDARHFGPGATSANCWNQFSPLFYLRKSKIILSLGLVASRQAKMRPPRSTNKTPRSAEPD